MRKTLALVLVLVAACGNGDSPGECRGLPDGGVAGATGVTLGDGTSSFRYDAFLWGENNDCPAAGSSIVSVTINSAQTDPPSDLGIGLCLPRPDVIGAGPISLADRNLVELVGASGSGDGCVLQPSFTTMPSGTVTFAGFCTTAGSSFTVTFAGSIAGTRTCEGGAPAENVTLTLAGTAIVRPR